MITPENSNYHDDRCTCIACNISCEEDALFVAKINKRHELTREDRSKGGKLQPREAKVRAGQKGFQRTMELHPHFGRKWLKKLIKGQYSREEFNHGH